MAGKCHCVTRKNHKFSSPTNPEVWYSSSCACTVKKNHGNSLESIQNKRKQKAFWSCVRSFIWSCGTLPSKPEVAVPLSLDPLSGVIFSLLKDLTSCAQICLSGPLFCTGVMGGIPVTLTSSLRDLDLAYLVFTQFLTISLSSGTCKKSRWRRETVR